jgi:ubiquinone/menaquinone biosynthesis C-methylase UbiE
LIAARIVGRRGSVTGIDPDRAALDIAQARANEENLSHLNFEQAAFETYTTDRPYDAIVGRHILIHSRDPLGWIRKAKSLLRSGGIAGFQEYDVSYFPPIEPELPLFTELREYLVEFFRRAVAYADVGARLYHWMQVTEFSNTRSSAECLMSGGVESSFYEWFAETIRSVTPLLESLGIASAADLDLDTLAIRLREEGVSCAGCLTTPLIVSCWGSEANSSLVFASSRIVITGCRPSSRCPPGKSRSCSVVFQAARTPAVSVAAHST